MNRRDFLKNTGQAVIALGMLNALWDKTYAASAGDPTTAARAMNALGLDLLRQGTEASGNALLSPFSIQTAFAMTWTGADGATKAEMAKVLHYPEDEAEVQSSFQALQKALDDIATSTTERAANAKKFGGASEPITLAAANRLFGQADYAFRDTFLKTVEGVYGAPLQALDFQKNSAGARKTINDWVADRTNKRIQDLVPPDGIDRDTRLVLVNAIFLKAPWTKEFPESATQPAPFHLTPDRQKDVPTMRHQDRFGYAREDGFTTVTIPYVGGEIQFLVLLPDAGQSLGALESQVTPERLVACGKSAMKEVLLYLPKFKLEPPLMRLSRALQTLGMKTAFNIPRGSANFDRMAPRRPGDYLCISEAFHKTFLALDEKGTEAAAATAVAMMRVTSAIMKEPDPIEVRVDRPFLFAIQHRASGACLFLGRVTDPS